MPFSDLQRTRHTHSAHTHLQAKHIKLKNWGTGYIIYPWLSWSSLYRPNWPRIHRPTVSASQLLRFNILLVYVWYVWMYVETRLTLNIFLNHSSHYLLNQVTSANLELGYLASLANSAPYRYPVYTPEHSEITGGCIPTWSFYARDLDSSPWAIKHASR